MRILLIAIFSLVLTSRIPAENTTPSGLVISSENQNYYEYKGRPTMIVSVTEHYFAVVNTKFDYDVYLNRLHDLGLNMASIMSGVFLEPSGQGEWEELVIPWKRSNQEGYRYGGNKFDLSLWDDAYFDRLEKFVSTANSRDIFVKYIFFAPIFDNHKWGATPFNPENNINREYAQANSKNIYTLDKHQGLIELQKGLIDRVTARLKNYPNVLYEVNFNGGREWVDYDWYRHIFDHLLERMPEPRKPVIFNMGMVREPEPVIFPEASGISYMYTGDEKLAQIVGKGKPVLHAESCFRPNWEPHVRQHAYRALLSGVGAYTFADFVFNARYPDGNRAPNPRALHGGGPDVHHSMAAVSKILKSVNFVKMRPEHSLVSFKNSEFEATVLADEGKEYLVYVSPTPAPQNYRVVFKGHIKPSTEGLLRVKAKANGTIRFVLGGKELINSNESSHYQSQSVAGEIPYDGGKPIPFELESKLSYYGHETGLFLETGSPQDEVITHERLLCTDAVTQGVEATYYTGNALDEKQLWRIEKKAQHKGVSSPFFKEDQVHQTSLAFKLPVGTYHCQWLDPKTASVIREFTIKHEGGEHRFATPAFPFDIALKIKKVE